MRVQFDEMPANARVWVYQSDRRLSKSEQSEIRSKTDRFIEQWTAHGSQLNGASTLRYDQFLIISVDEHYNQVSGCSIDSSVHFIQQLERDYQVEFLDRTKVAFLKKPDNGQEVVIYPLSNIKSLVKDNIIKPDTMVFNNLVQSKGDLEKSWLTPVKNTWLKKYFE